MSGQISRRDFLKTASLASLGAFIGCSVKNRFDLIIRREPRILSWMKKSQFGMGSISAFARAIFS